MRIIKGLIETPVTRPGMLIGEALRICVERGVPGLPFVDQSGKVTGRFSVRHAFLLSSISSDMIKGAHLIGHDALCLSHGPDHYGELFALTIEQTILEDAACLPSNALVEKGMALMEKFNSSYLFVIDDERYRGVVTRLSLTRALLEEHA